METFTTTTVATVAAILKIFIVVAVAGFLVRRKILTVHVGWLGTFLGEEEPARNGHNLRHRIN